MGNILEVQALRKEFDGIVAVNHLSFAIQRGSITALIGPNGAGKTTVFHLITGFLKPDGGSIVFNHRNITGIPPHKIARAGISRTFQRIRLFPQITVMENMLLAMKDRKGEDLVSPLFQRKKILAVDRRKREKALEILKRVGLEQKHNELARNLSHGQRKLLELARAIATDADLFLLDEPTAGVFPETRETIMGIFRDLVRQGRTILFVEHNMRVVMEVSDRVMVLSSGTLIADGKPEEVARDPVVIEAYLGKETHAA